MAYRESLPIASANPSDHGKVEEVVRVSVLPWLSSHLCWLWWLMNGCLVRGRDRPEQLVTSTTLTDLRDLEKHIIELPCAPTKKKLLEGSRCQKL